MSREVVYDIDDVNKWYRKMFALEGTDFREAYDELFPVVQPDPRAHYQILNDDTNRRIMAAIYSNGRLGINDLAKKLALTPKQVVERLTFFKANGLRRDVAKKYI